LTLGHEYSGITAEVGEGVTNLTAGDKVTALVTVNYCGHCLPCLKGEFYSCTGAKNMEYECDGAMTEYIAVPAAGIFKLPDSVSLEEGAMVEQAGVAAGNAVFERAHIKPNGTVAIMGAGQIGLLILLQFVKLCGAKAIVISRGKKKLELAKKFGADYILANDQCDAITEARKLTLGRG
jgi:threonine dehydrogenase-like Zn-dependent dehydrogenase